MSDVLPYLPDIFKGVSARVNTVFSTRQTDRFKVLFDYGIYADVSKNVTKSKITDPLIWLVMRYSEERGKEPTIYANVTCELIITMPTNSHYTMQERTDKIFKPRLLPVYDEVLNQISLEPMFGNPDKEKIEHSKRDRPYWGGGEENNVNQKNLFKQEVEAVQILGLKLSVKNIKNCTPFSNL